MQAPGCPCWPVRSVSAPVRAGGSSPDFSGAAGEEGLRGAANLNEKAVAAVPPAGLGARAGCWGLRLRGLLHALPAFRCREPEGLVPTGPRSSPCARRAPAGTPSANSPTWAGRWLGRRQWGIRGRGPSAQMHGQQVARLLSVDGVHSWEGGGTVRVRGTVTPKRVVLQPRGASCLCKTLRPRRLSFQPGAGVPQSGAFPGPVGRYLGTFWGHQGGGWGSRACLAPARSPWRRCSPARRHRAQRDPRSPPPDRPLSCVIGATRCAQVDAGSAGAREPSRVEKQEKLRRSFASRAGHSHRSSQA